MKPLKKDTFSCLWKPKMIDQKPAENYLFADLQKIILQARSQTQKSINSLMVISNYLIGMRIVKDEQKNIGIILCKKKKGSLVEITLPKEANIHAAKYQTYLPDKDELKKQLEDAQNEWEANHESNS